MLRICPYDVGDEEAVEHTQSKIDIIEPFS